MTLAPSPYESTWGWLVAPDPDARAALQAAMGERGRVPEDLAAALRLLADADIDSPTLLALDAWLAGGRYVASPRPAFTKLPFDYRRIPPRVRGAMLGLLERTRGSGVAPFPVAPVEERLDEARERVWTAAALRAGVSLISPQWPDGCKAAVLLTHDIDVVPDLDRMDSLRDLERGCGLPSAFGFVPRVSWPDRARVESLVADGCEVYVHDYTHDGRFPYAGRDRIEAAFAGIFAADPWAREQFRGFRSGQLLMTPELLAAVGNWFDYDLSIPDVERGGPYGGMAGAGTVVPFAVGGLIELPLTLPQDFFVEQVLGLSPDEIVSAWRDKLEWVVARGGVAVVNTHPIWVNPGRSGMWKAYAGLLAALAEDPRLWVTTPAAVVGHLRGLREGAIDLKGRASAGGKRRTAGANE